MARKSSAALAIVQQEDQDAPDVRKLRRPPPPADLTPEQAAEWVAIVAQMRADWFRRENFALLAAYCRVTVTLRHLARARDGLETGKRRFNLDHYERVAKLIARETQLLASLARQMRLSQHASYDKKKSKGPTVPPPWVE